RACLEAGRDGVGDKPFTTTRAEARELAGLAWKQGKLLAVYQERRLDGDCATLGKLVREGSLGRRVTLADTLERCRTQVEDSWQERVVLGCSVLCDVAPHLIEHALVLFGEPEALMADLRMERDGARNVDAFDVTLYYRSGFRAVLSSTTLAPVARPHFRVRG